MLSPDANLTASLGYSLGLSVSQNPLPNENIPTRQLKTIETVKLFWKAKKT